MSPDFVATQSVIIAATLDRVWNALVDPAAIKAYMFGTDVVTEWTEGSSITWKGEWQGKPYEDRGIILANQPARLLRYSHFSPLSGLPDTPENYHTVTVELEKQADGVLVTLTQDNNPTEKAREHSEANWAAMLEALKAFVEKP